MPNFIATDTFPDVPKLEDGKPANAAYLNEPHQALVNRTHWLKETISQGGLTRQGVTRIRSVETIDELKALTGMAPGDMCQVGRFGTYIYAGPLAGGYDVWIVESTAVPGTYWRHSLLDMTAHTTGLVRRDTQGRIGGTLGAVTLEGPLTIGAGGSIRQRVVMVEPETPGTTTYDFACSVERGDVFVAAIPGGSDAPSCKLSDDGAFPGARVRFVRANPGRLSVTDTVASAVLWSKIWAVGDPWNDAASEFLYVNASVRWVRIQ